MDDEDEPQPDDDIPTIKGEAPPVDEYRLSTR